MITKNNFIKFIKDYQAWNKYVEDASDFLKSDIVECPLITYTDTLFQDVMKSFFSKAGADDIDWWLFEKYNNPELKMFDKNNKEIPTETLDDLWNIVKDERQ